MNDIQLMSPKKRIDQILVERNFFQSRTDAQKAILAGYVRVKSQLVHKSNEIFLPDVDIEVLSRKRFVSRGGEKIDPALDAFSIQLEGKVVLDVGSSTGGFTHCVLQRGAQKVYAVDVGYGQLDISLRNDPRVVVLEKVNARYLKEEDFPEKMDFITIDVSFISLDKILPAVIPLLKEKGEVVALVKPQFEVGKSQVGKGGVVREESDRLAAVEKISFFAQSLKCQVLNDFQSPLKGPAGNVEYFLHLKKIEE